MGIASIKSGLASALGGILKKDMDSFFFLETGISGTNNVVAADGSIMSVIRIDGLKKMAGAEEMAGVIDEMNLKLSSYFDASGHALQVWFARDPDASKELVSRLNRPARIVSDKLKLNLEDVFDERENHLSDFITWEGCYLALWTRPSVLTKTELESIKRERKKPDAWPQAASTQDVFRASRQLITRHDSFVAAFLADLKTLNLRADVLEAHDAIGAVRGSLYPDLQGADWKPALPGDKVFQRNPSWAKGDVSHLFVPPLRDQVFSRGGEVLSPRIVRVGRYNFATLDMTVGPQEVRPFSELLNRMLMGKEFPWRASFLLEGNGLSGEMQLKSTLAAVVGFTNSENVQIREAINAMQDLKRNGEEVIVRYRVSFATWAPVDNVRLLEERVSQLQRSVESWGYCGVTSSSGDPLASFMSSALGVDVASTGAAGAPPMRDALYMMPWNRDASPWEKGSVLFRTPDGRPWPYEPGSSKQSTFIDLIFAPPGYAKSVFLNTTNLALCLSPSATSSSSGVQLPRVAIIDIGPSSSGLISLIKEALPADKRHQAQYRRLRMIKDHAINPFDTQLGCRYPLPLERAFLVNFLSILGTPVGDKAPPSGLSDLAGMVVDEVYKELDDQSRRGNPRLYSPQEDEAVDAALKRYDIKLDEEATWWDVVDKLFEVGDLHAATLAQRFAVPLIQDLNVVVRKTQVQDVHGSAKTTTGEPLIDVFQRMISSALREYEILTVPTRFDIGDSRVVSLDIDEAAPRGGDPADKQTSLVYMLARFVLARDFYLNEEVVHLIPESYQRHHEKRINALREIPKKIVMDEFHRTKSTPQVRDQVMVDLREGRKWGVHIALASQLLEDFDDSMVDVATGVWIMGVGTERAAKKANEIFGLSPAANRVLRTKLNGPGPRGAPFLAILNLKDGAHEHLLYNTLGPMELWAFSTTPEDAKIRNSLYNRIGPQEARRRLAKRWANGSAKADVELRTARLAEQGLQLDDDQGVIEGLVDELAED
ncbi:ATP-binding protein [Salipiger mucosus]|uniref:IcmB (DotO) protein n=1 Tax=Salipiger mucosus DSM 16094 TaxID=1123237 RepID=S9SCN2_9RHOB|nr:ATP-binding protein [Salipiger mucosus]EPX83994.1 IcmB (DotO) protein [Salipiger mucosus DSM 16094]